MIFPLRAGTEDPPADGHLAVRCHHDRGHPPTADERGLGLSGALGHSAGEASPWSAGDRGDHACRRVSGSGA